MIRPATEPFQRPTDARLLVVGADGSLRHVARMHLPGQLRSGDLLVANDAATIPASLRGVHVPTGEAVEVRLAGRASLERDRVDVFTAIAFGAGDHRTRTEERPPPPRLRPGDRLALGPLGATVSRLLSHPRLVEVRFDGRPDAIWDGIARHGRPVQYAHLRQPLALWDVWTSVAAAPVALEPPSTGFALDWRMLSTLREADVGFATLTLAAGISSTGDPELDALLPFDEAYHVPDSTARRVGLTRAVGGRVVALGTTVARALEHASIGEGLVRAGPGLATNTIGEETRLQVVDAIVTGVHEPGESHYELLRAFASARLLRRVSDALKSEGYRSHEFGDSVLVERQASRGCTSHACAC